MVLDAEAERLRASQLAAGLEAAASNADWSGDMLDGTAAVLLELAEWAGTPERFEAVVTEAGFEYGSLELSDFLTHVPFALGLAGEFERAEELLDALAGPAPDSVQYGELAVQLARAGQFGEAERVIDIEHRRVPPSWLAGLAEMQAGEIALMQDDLDSAEDWYARAAELAGSVDNLHLEREAERELAELLDLRPGREGDATRARRRADAVSTRIEADERSRNVPVVVREPKTGRNEPCPCGSGRKWKRCHGA